MKLDEKGRRVLYWIEMNATDSISRIARAVKLREGVVRYQVSLLKDTGILKRKRTFINSYPFGFTHYVIYFALGASPAKKREGFLRALCDLPQVWWLAELGGNYHYAVSFSARHISEVIEAIEKVLSVHSVTIVQKTISVRVAVYRFSRKYLIEEPKGIRAFKLGYESEMEGEMVELNQGRESIISSIAYRDELSHRELAKAAEMPVTTFERHLKELEKIGVIQGYFYEVDLSSLGILQYLFLVRTRGFRKELGRKMFDFAKKHRLIRKLVQCVGEWDFELEVNVYNAEELKAVSSDLSEFFGDELLYVSVIPVLAHKSTPPFALVT